MENEKKYLTFSHPLPGPTGFLFKKTAEKNAAYLRTLTIAEHREANERLADVRMIAPGIRFCPETCLGVPCEWVFREEYPADRVILYLHGGSWAFGNLHTARAAATFLSTYSGYRVLVAEYRLAPEHPYPAGAEDCAAVYFWLRQNGFSAEQIALFGDSAGGNLSLSLLQRLRQQEQPMPAAVALASPATDLSETSAFFRRDEDLLYTQHEGREQDILSLYCGGHDRKDPLISPYYGNFSMLPPMLIHVGQEEALCVDCDLFAAKAWQAGNIISLKIWREMYHDFSIVGNTLKESRRSMTEFSDFLRENLR